MIVSVSVGETSAYWYVRQAQRSPVRDVPGRHDVYSVHVAIHGRSSAPTADTSLGQPWFLRTNEYNVARTARKING